MFDFMNNGGILATLALKRNDEKEIEGSIKW
jgi:hypothetical protein